MVPSRADIILTRINYQRASWDSIKGVLSRAGIILILARLLELERGFELH